MHNVFKTRWNILTCFENLNKCVKLIGNIFKLPYAEDNIRIGTTTYSDSNAKFDLCSSTERLLLALLICIHLYYWILNQTGFMLRELYICVGTK